MTRPPWLDEVAAALSQPLDAAGVCGPYRDFGAAPLGAPRAVVRTVSRRELCHVLGVARRWRVPLALRGSGHSSGGHTAAPGGLVLEHRPSEPGAALDGDRIAVPGHWPWWRVEQALTETSFALPVTTSSVETTVAGTLSVGGIGPRSVCHGAQVDQVRALDLVVATGELVRCSAEQHPELFHSALTGLGQVGVIERVVLDTAPRREHLSCVTTRHQSFAGLAREVAWLADAESPGPDYFRVLGKQGELTGFWASAHATRELAERDAAAGSSWARGPRQVLAASEFEREERSMPLAAWAGCRHLWADYCFDVDGFGRFAEFVDRELADSLRGQLSLVLCIAPRRGVPLALDLRPSAQRSFSLGLFYSVPAEDVAGVERARVAHCRALERCFALGGRPYLHGLWGGRAGLTAAELDTCFGAGAARLRAQRRTFDPGGILNPFTFN